MEQFFLRPDETLEDLGRGGLMILQKRKGFRFGTDSILLSDFANGRGAARIGDFGAGSGILTLLISANAPSAKFDAWEIQPEIADMAARSVKLNALESRITVHAGDARAAVGDVGYGALDLVVCNPPYFRGGTAIKSETESLAIAKHGDKNLLEELMLSAAKVLRYGGRLCAVYPADGAVDLLCALRQAKVEPKRIRFVHSSLAKPPILILAEGMRGAKPSAKILPPLELSDASGAPTAEVRKIYHMN